MTGQVNAVAWLGWFVAVVILPLTSRNPVYLALLLLIVLMTFLTLPNTSGRANPWRYFAYIGSGVALLSILFNVLTVHVGDRVFATLPEWLPIIGGNLTVNALVYGAISATAISAVLFAASTFNSAVRHADLVRMLPGSLSRAGVAIGIALLFVPQTIASARDIYDAQRARGHYFRGIGDARAFVVPLLSTGMERALMLSEALEVRGFGASAAIVQPARWRGPLILAAVACTGVALFLIGTGNYPGGMAAIVAGGGLLLVASPSTARRTRYRSTAWTAPSIVVIAASTTSALVLLFGRTITNLHLGYDTFPRIDVPGFAPVAGVAILLLMTPAMVNRP